MSRLRITPRRLGLAAALPATLLAITTLPSPAEASLTTVSTVFEETFDDADTNTGWTQTALQTRDRRGRFLHWSNGGTATTPGTSGNAITVAASANAPAFSPTFTPGLDGSYRLSFDYFLGSSGEFSTNWTTVRLVNDAAPNGPSWGLLLGATSPTQSHPDIVRVLRNDGSGEAEIASSPLDFGANANNGVGALFTLTLEIDATLDTVEVYSAVNGGPETLLLNAADAATLVGLNQIRLTSAIGNNAGTDLNTQFFDNFTVQANVPEPGSLSALSLGSLILLARRRRDS